MKTFIKQIEEICKDYYFYSIINEMQLIYLGKTTRVAIVAIRRFQDSERCYKIFYQYSYMKSVDKYGYFTDYAEACKEFSTFAR